ncbi:MAG TPA: sigma factor [Anoxybacillus sp.]|nr:sigma factor [Anoxybacillus sp.]
MKADRKGESEIQDEALIAKVKKGNEHAFRLLVEKYRHYLFKTVYAIIRNEKDAEDVTQEVFVRIYLSLPQYQSQGFKTWMTCIAVNYAIDVKRKMQRQREEILEVIETEVFGTYQSLSANDIKNQENYVAMNIVGDTMYITIKEMPRKEGLFHTMSAMNPTVIIPQHLSLEVRGDYNSVLLYPRQLAANWTVSKAEGVHIELNKNTNILVTAVTREMLEDGNIAWQRESAETQEALPTQTFKGKVQLGNGTHHIYVFDSQRAAVHVLD